MWNFRTMCDLLNGALDSFIRQILSFVQPAIAREVPY
jgi:hypothetical protein